MIFQDMTEGHQSILMHSSDSRARSNKYKSEGVYIIDVHIKK